MSRSAFNPGRDEHERRLERRAAAGDLEARRELLREQQRSGTDPLQCLRGELRRLGLAFELWSTDTLGAMIRVIGRGDSQSEHEYQIHADPDGTWPVELYDHESGDFEDWLFTGDVDQAAARIAKHYHTTVALLEDAVNEPRACQHRSTTRSSRGWYCEECDADLDACENCGGPANEAWHNCLAYDRARPNPASRNAPRFTPGEYNYWVNWALYAILGRLSEADGLMQQYGKEIRSAAKKLVRSLGVPRRPLYRGMVLDPGEAPGGVLPASSYTTFVSWSEDKDVACWFADRDSIMSGFVRLQRPKISGWLAESWPDKKRVLFHWSWASRFPLPGNRGSGPLWLFAQHHPDMIPDQVEWAMRSQKEVILVQDGKPIKIKPYASAGCPPTRELDTRLTFRP